MNVSYKKLILVQCVKLVKLNGSKFVPTVNSRNVLLTTTNFTLYTYKFHKGNFKKTISEKR